MKTSWRRCVAFSQVASAYTAQHPDESKLNYAIKRVVVQIGKLNEGMQIKFEDIDLDNCTTVLTDPKNPESAKVIVRDEQGRLRFTAEQTKIVRDLRAALLDKEDIEIEPHFCNEIPETMEEGVREIFAGFVIREDESKLSAVA